MKKNSFFTLEIAIVTSIVATLISLSTYGLYQYSENSKVKANFERMERVRSALRLYFINNKRLPCPAPLVGYSAAGFGKESLDSNNLGCLEASTGVATFNYEVNSVSAHKYRWGMIPVLDLGLSKNDAYDAYGNAIEYFTYNGIANMEVIQKNPNSNVSGLTFVYIDKTKTDVNPAGTTDADSVYVSQDWTNRRIPMFIRTVHMNPPSTDSQSRMDLSRGFYIGSLRSAIYDISNPDQPIEGTIDNIAYTVISHGKEKVCYTNIDGTRLHKSVTSIKNRNCYETYGGSLGVNKVDYNNRYKFITTGKVDNYFADKSYTEALLYDRVEDLLADYIVSGKESFVRCNLITHPSYSALTLSERQLLYSSLDRIVPGSTWYNYTCSPFGYWF